jgi:hypothetical protein
MNELQLLCPICMETPAEIITNCNHKLCICCLSRIKICAICRSPLQMTKLCIEIKNAYERRHNINKNLIQNNYSHFFESPSLYYNIYDRAPQITFFRLVYRRHTQFIAAT